MRWWIVMVGVGCASGCASAEENCAEAKQAATDGWATYIAQLETELAQAKTNATALTNRMRETIGPRMSTVAEQAADQRYDRNTPAWHREYDAQLKAGCTVDDECKQLKLDERATAQRIDEIKELAAKAVEAKRLVGEDIISAPAAAKAVEDFERASIKQPRQLTDQARDRCAELD